MPVNLNPYLNFRGTAREAIDFYRTVFGGEVSAMTFGDMGDMPGIGADEKDLVMHAQLQGEDGLLLMAADVPASMPVDEGSSITVSLSGDDEQRLRGYWDKLSAGGTVTWPLDKAPWGDTFGMCTDRFGTPWMVNIAGSA